MVNFTPEGLFSDFLAVLAPYAPPPPPAALSPAFWGSEAHLHELFADRVDFVELARRAYSEGAPSPRDYVELIKQTFGPVVAVYGSLADDPERSAAADRDFLEFADPRQQRPTRRAGGDHYEYLLAIARKRPAAG
jgi:hypothetical protein